jgi:hypothetical protein
MPMTDAPAVRKPHPHFQPTAAVLPPVLTDFDRFKGTFHNEFDKTNITQPAGPAVCREGLPMHQDAPFCTTLAISPRRPSAVGRFATPLPQFRDGAGAPTPPKAHPADDGLAAAFTKDRPSKTTFTIFG